jgi:hypothetical protein
MTGSTVIKTLNCKHFQKLHLATEKTFGEIYLFLGIPQPRTSRIIGLNEI